MKKYTLIAIILSFNIATIAQKKTVNTTISKPVVVKKRSWYYPDGRLVSSDPNHFRTIKEAKESMPDEDLRVDGNIKDDIFIYKPLAYTPKLIWTTDSITAISYSKRSNYKKYALSNFFVNDFEIAKESGITQDSIIKLLGEPDAKEEYNDVYIRHYYPHFYIQYINVGDLNSPDKVVRMNYDGAKSHGLGILDFHINLSDIDDNYVTGFRARFYNSSKKRIKYLYTTVTAFNSVDDVVSRKTSTSIGPIEPGKLADYSFDKMFFSSIIDYVKITGIKVQYFDGTTKVYPSTIIKSLYIDKD